MMVVSHDSLTQQLDRLLEEHGVVTCLFALANALRGENDRSDPRKLSVKAMRTATVREYLANQVTGLAAFWRLQVPAEKR